MHHFTPLLFQVIFVGAYDFTVSTINLIIVVFQRPLNFELNEKAKGIQAKEVYLIGCVNFRHLFHLQLL